MNVNKLPVRHKQVNWSEVELLLENIAKNLRMFFTKAKHNLVEKTESWMIDQATFQLCFIPKRCAV